MKPSPSSFVRPAPPFRVRVGGGLALVLAALSSWTACGGPPPAVPSPPAAVSSVAPATSVIPVPPSQALPSARRDDTHDTLFGTVVNDPYRWLEDGASADTLAFTHAQNDRTRALLDAFPGRAKLHARLLELGTIGHIGTPVVREDGQRRRYFQSSRERGQDQYVVLVRDGLTGTPRTLIDPNTLSRDGTSSLDWWFASPRGRLVAYGISQGGDEESTLLVKDVTTGKDLPDRLPHTRHASVAFAPDEKGFYYTRYPEKGSVPAGDEKYFRKVYFHVLGEDQAKDELVWEPTGDKTDSPSFDLSPDGRWLALRVHQSWSKNEVWLLDRKTKAKPVVVAQGKEALYNPEILDDTLFIHTNEGAPKYRLFAVKNTEAGDRSKWHEVLPEGADVLDGVTVIGHELIASFTKDVSSRVRRFDQKGKLLGEIALPGIGSVTAVTGARKAGDEVFIGFSSFGTPPTIFRAEKDKPLVGFAKVDAPVDPASIEVSQRHATSKDGTKVPYFVIRKAGTSGPAPTLIHAYGGFNIALLPDFHREWIVFLESGGVIVEANLRGGAELGEAWHQGGMRDKKQNVFDDLYAVADDVVTAGIADAKRRAVWGGSNGGLLTAVAVTQRPELWRAVVSSVPLCDMIRFPQFLIAKLWTGEYGDPAKEAEFPWLMAYSPYHHTKPGTAYPATFFLTAEGDSRVDPMHARKMAAQLQYATAGAEPILLRVETKAGHGAGKPVSKRVEEHTDVYSFLFDRLGMKP
jgi:prolyl oligopeptidase